MHIPELFFWRDSAFRGPSLQMALDESLFHLSIRSGSAVARFYSWDRSATTIGYFVQNPDVAWEPVSNPAIRRFTGGGLVEHGEDLTFLLAFPASSAPAKASATERYRWIHEALAASLVEEGLPILLQALRESKTPGPCFASPVSWDLLDSESGRKIGGGAQRRSHGAVIHQGSVRLPVELRDPSSPWIDCFLLRLAEVAIPIEENVRSSLLLSAIDLEKSRYGNRFWNVSG